MVVAIGRVKTDADNRAELVRIGQRVAAASRGEAGCISYRVYEDTEDEKAFVFVEEWRSEEALQQHFGTPHVAEFMAAIRDVIVDPPDVKFHTIASSRDLADVGAA
jgi:quinol monooxygenase YgiN